MQINEGYSSVVIYVCIIRMDVQCFCRLLFYGFVMALYYATVYPHLQG